MKKTSVSGGPLPKSRLPAVEILGGKVIGGWMGRGTGDQRWERDGCGCI